MTPANTQAHYGAYKAARATASKPKQVVMLYEGVIKFLQQAQTAIVQHDVETRFVALTKAADILQGLDSCLDFDNGGDSAEILHDFYQDLHYQINRVHQTGDAGRCESILSSVREMLDVWRNIAAEEEDASKTGSSASSGNASAAPSVDAVTHTTTTKASAGSSSTVHAPTTAQNESLTISV